MTGGRARGGESPTKVQKIKTNWAVDKPSFGSPVPKRGIPTLPTTVQTKSFLAHLASNEGSVQEVNGDLGIVDPESQVLDLGAGDALDVGKLLKVEGWVLGAVLVDVQQNWGC